MFHWLKNASGVGANMASYVAATTAEKDRFLKAWFAKEMGSPTGTRLARDSRRLVTEQGKLQTGKWWGQAKMIAEFGETKALAKIEALDKLPDRHT